MVTPMARREALEILKTEGLSERAACQIAGVSRRIASYKLKQPAKDKELGTGSWELGAGSWELGAGSWERSSSKHPPAIRALVIVALRS